MVICITICLILQDISAKKNQITKQFKKNKKKSGPLNKIVNDYFSNINA